MPVSFKAGERPNEDNSSKRRGTLAVWNYSFTIPSAMILLILVLYYFRRPRLPVRMNITYLSLLLIDTLTLLFDYLSSRADELYASYPLSLCYLLNLLFFVFFLARIYWFFLFVLDILDNYGVLSKWVRPVSPVVFLLSELVSLSSPLTHAVFYMDEGGYHRGPFYSVLYVCFFFYLIAASLLVLKNRCRLTRDVCGGLFFALLILFVGNVVRILLPSMLVMNTFCLMAILVFYLSFENPDLYLSDRGSAFNMRAFKLLLAEWSRKASCHLLSFVLRDYSEIRGIYGGMQMDEAIGLISVWLTEHYPKCQIFYLRNGSFALVSPRHMDAHSMSAEITGRFESPWICGETEMMLRPGFVELELDRTEAGTDHMISTLLLALENAGQADYREDPSAPLSIQAADRYLAEKQALDAALDNGRLEVYLQPIVNSRTGNLIGAEALSRIRRDDGTLIPPSVFIPMAEKDGVIIALGEQVLRKICRFIRDNDLPAMGLAWINVNLSPYQCMSPDLPGRFRAILEEFGVEPALIHLELTEQSIADYELLKNQLLALQEIGFQFALDDYGSGYSNLTRVKRYPFKNIKMDMEVVWNYIHDRDPLLPTMVQVFRQMHFTITAEGIETREMAEAMAEIGCDYLQGYYFSKPVPMAEFLEKYRK